MSRSINIKIVPWIQVPQQQSRLDPDANHKGGIQLQANKSYKVKYKLWENLRLPFRL